MKKIKVLLCMLSLMSLVALTACDDDDDNGGGGGGGGGGTNGLAPATLAGSTMTATVTDSISPPFNAAGTTYTLVFADDGTYTVDGNAGGNWTYTPNSDNTAVLVLDDAALQDQITSFLTFDSATSGSYQSDNSAADAFEDGTFTLSTP